MAIFVLTVVIHMIDTFSYAVRVAAVRTGRLAMALSLFNIILLVARTANMVQAPLLGSLVDDSIAKGTSFFLLDEFRLVIFAATVGSILGAALIPTFISIFTRGIRGLEDAGSVPRLLLIGTSRKGLRAIRGSITRPTGNMLRKVQVSSLPKTFLILNVAITAVYTIGVLASIYAGVLLPAYRLTASQLSGIINGTATILFALLVDPKAALITDQAIQGIRKPQDVDAMVVLLTGGKILGTVLAQLVFLPAASIIVYFTHIIVW